MVAIGIDKLLCALEVGQCMVYLLERCGVSRKQSCLDAYALYVVVGLCSLDGVEYAFQTDRWVAVAKH